MSYWVSTIDGSQSRQGIGYYLIHTCPFYERLPVPFRRRQSNVQARAGTTTSMLSLLVVGTPVVSKPVSYSASAPVYSCPSYISQLSIKDGPSVRSADLTKQLRKYNILVQCRPISLVRTATYVTAFLKSIMSSSLNPKVSLNSSSLPALSICRSR